MSTGEPIHMVVGPRTNGVIAFCGESLAGSTVRDWADVTCRACLRLAVDAHHCWKCHKDLKRTETRTLCYSCCDDMEDAGGRTVLSDAPAMLELLREIQWGPEMGRDSERHCQVCKCPESEPHAGDCKLAALLARIDGGT